MLRMPWCVANQVAESELGRDSRKGKVLVIRVCVGQHKNLLWMAHTSRQEIWA